MRVLGTGNRKKQEKAPKRACQSTTPAANGTGFAQVKQRGSASKTHGIAVGIGPRKQKKKQTKSINRKK